jgi:hypothetical protein
VKIAELLKAQEDTRAELEAALAGLDETQLLAAGACAPGRSRMCWRT